MEAYNFTNKLWSLPRQQFQIMSKATFQMPPTLVNTDFETKISHSTKISTTRHTTHRCKGYFLILASVSFFFCKRDFTKV